jgi:O-antigen ligase
MEGPSGQDENIFAARLLIVLPFYYYLFYATKNKPLKFTMLLMIPLCWHAIFLTSSRGGLLALSITTLLFIYHLDSKFLKLFLPIVFIVALLTQSGQLLNRFQSEEQEIVTLENQTVDPRIESWTAGLEMTFDNPFLGVGFERFQQATSFYGYSTPFVAHNTLLQISANSGLLAGVLFVVIIFVSTKPFLLKKYTDKENILHNIYNACALSLIGYVITSMFLNLLLYEMTFFLILVNSLINYFINNDEVSN